MVFNRKLKSAVKERKTKQRLAKKKCKAKDVHVATKVLVSGKRTGSQCHLSVYPVDMQDGVYPVDMQDGTSGFRCLQERQRRGRRGQAERPSKRK